MIPDFARTDLWPVLLVAPLVWLALWALDRRRVARLERAAGPRFRAVAPTVSERVRALRRLLAAAGVLLVAIAILHPVGGASPRGVRPRGVDVVVCLDVSRSMLARDIAPTRLDRAKEEIRTLAARAEGDRFALVAFAGEARVVVPLTRDVESFLDVASRTDPLAVRLGGTDLGAALDAARGVLGAGTGARGVVLLLTDGEDLGGRGARAAESLREAGVAVHCVGLGSSRGSKIAVAGPSGESFLRDRAGNEVVSALDAASLRRLAEAAGGTYADTTSSPRPLVGIYEQSVLPMERDVQEAEDRRRRQPLHGVPLAAALLLWTLDLALTDRRRAPRAGTVPIATAPRRSGGLAASAASALLALLVLPGCDATAEGARAYEEGRFADALAAFREAEARAGGGASAALLHDQALAALRAGALDDAEAAADAAAARGGPEFAALRDFVRGNVAFARCEAAEIETFRPGAPAESYDRAIALADAARDAWIAAARTRDDWPEARRNAERALLAAARLRTRQAEEKLDRGRGPGAPPPPPEPVPGPKGPPPKPPEDVPEAPAAGTGTEPGKEPDVAQSDLPQGEVLRILDRLREKEREKTDIRRARRDAQPASVERDW